MGLNKSYNIFHNSYTADVFKYSFKLLLNIHFIKTENFLADIFIAISFHKCTIVMFRINTLFDLL